MNRIVFIGNGFDLAHGLPTRYEDFINWYWEKRVDSFTGNLSLYQRITFVLSKLLQTITIAVGMSLHFVFLSFLTNRPVKRLLIVLPMILNLLSFRCLRFLRIYVFVLKLKGGLT